MTTFNHDIRSATGFDNNYFNMPKSPAPYFCAVCMKFHDDIISYNFYKYIALNFYLPMSLVWEDGLYIPGMIADRRIRLEVYKHSGMNLSATIIGVVDDIIIMRKNIFTTFSIPLSEFYFPLTDGQFLKHCRRTCELNDIEQDAVSYWRSQSRDSFLSHGMHWMGYIG